MISFIHTYDRLKLAHTNLVDANIPITEGYYYLVSAQDYYLKTFGHEKAVYANIETMQLCYKTFDPKDDDFVFRVTKADDPNEYWVQHLLSGTYVGNPSNWYASIPPVTYEKEEPQNIRYYDIGNCSGKWFWGSYHQHSASYTTTTNTIPNDIDGVLINWGQWKETSTKETHFNLWYLRFARDLDPATSVSIDKESLVFNYAGTQFLKAETIPVYAKQTVVWHSSNQKVVTVNENGEVTPVGNGAAFVIATTTDGTELSDSCLVTVDFKATSVTIDKSSLTFNSFEPQMLAATVSPAEALADVVWSSSDEDIATVDATGNIMPAKNGSATITATTTDGTNLSATCSIRVNINNMFKATSTQTTVAISSNTEVGEVTNLQVLLNGVKYDLSNEDAKITGLAPGKTYHVITTAVINGNRWTEELDVTMKDVTVNFDCVATATTLVISANYDIGDATLTSASFDAENQVSKIEANGLEPNRTYSYTYYVTTEEGGTVNYTARYSTEPLELKTTQAKVVSVGNLLVSAESNITEEEDVNVGFEWRRYDWPDEIASSTGAAFIYEGKIEGSIRNLNADKFWKIRPYFKSSSGRMYYGNWITIDPSNTSYFEPTVHTYAKIEVEGNTATVKGYALGGSDEVREQGFKYWEVIQSGASPKYPQATEVPVYAKTVTASGQLMTAELQNLQYEMEYRYVAFVTTADDKTYYGEVQNLKIDDPTGIQTVEAETPATGEVKVYTLTGALIYSGSEDEMQLEKGLYIIRHSDGKNKKVVIR